MIKCFDVRPLRQSELLQPFIPKLSVKIGIGLQVLGCLAGSYAIPTMRKEFSYNEANASVYTQNIKKTNKQNHIYILLYTSCFAPSL